MNIQRRVQLSPEELQSRLEAGEQLDAADKKKAKAPLFSEIKRLKVPASTSLDPKGKEELERLLQQEKEATLETFKDALRPPGLKGMSTQQLAELARKHQRYF